LVSDCPRFAMAPTKEPLLAKKKYSWADKHFSTDLHRFMWWLLLGSGCQAVTVFFPGSIPKFNSNETDDAVDFLSYVAKLAMSMTLIVGCLMFVWYCYPHRVLKASTYRSGKVETVSGFWERHFGTPTLLGVQMQFLGVAAYAVCGAIQVCIGYQSNAVIPFSTGIANILAGVLGGRFMWVFCEGCYPEAMIAPPGRKLEEWLTTSRRAKRWLGEKKAAEWARKSPDNQQAGAIVLFAVMLLSLLGLPAQVARVTGFDWPSAKALVQLGGSLGNALCGYYFYQFSYSNDLVAPAIYGYWQQEGLQGRGHPMGPTFNKAISKEQVSAGITAALGARDAVAWEEVAGQEGTMWQWTDDCYAGVMTEVEIAVPPFALRFLLQPIEAKQSDPTVESVEVLESLSEDAQVMRIRRKAQAPLPPAVEVFVTAAEERADKLVVAEWAVAGFQIKDEKVMKVQPFQLFELTPTADGRGTILRATLIQEVAYWMPVCMMLQFMRMGAGALAELSQVVHSPDGAGLVLGIRAQVWSQALGNLSPTQLAVFHAQCPQVAALGVAAAPLPNISPALDKTPVVPEQADQAVAVGAALIAGPWRSAAGQATRPYARECVSPRMVKPLPPVAAVRVAAPMRSPRTPREIVTVPSRGAGTPLARPSTANAYPTPGSPVPEGDSTTDQSSTTGANGEEAVDLPDVPISLGPVGAFPALQLQLRESNEAIQVQGLVPNTRCAVAAMVVGSKGFRCRTGRNFEETSTVTTSAGRVTVMAGSASGAAVASVVVDVAEGACMLCEWKVNKSGKPQVSNPEMVVWEFRQCGGDTLCFATARKGTGRDSARRQKELVAAVSDVIGMLETQPSLGRGVAEGLVSGVCAELWEHLSPLQRSFMACNEPGLLPPAT